MLNLSNACFGVLYYTFILVAYATQAFAASSVLVFYLTRAVTAMIVTSAFVSLYLLYVLLIQMNELCALCLTIHAINFMLLLLDIHVTRQDVHHSPLHKKTI
jgi:uncharacterized membrane protein